MAQSSLCRTLTCLPLDSGPHGGGPTTLLLTDLPEPQFPQLSNKASLLGSPHL